MRRVVEYTRAGSAIGPSLAFVFAVAEAEERDDEAADANEWFDGLRWCWWVDNGTASARFLLLVAPVLPGVPVAEGEAKGVPDAPEAGGRGGRSSDAGVGPLCRCRCCFPVPSFASLGVGGVWPCRCPAMIEQDMGKL